MSVEQDSLGKYCDAFLQAWNSGNPPKIADFLKRVPEQIRPRLLRELIKIDWERRLLDGDYPSVADYAPLDPKIGEWFLPADSENESGIDSNGTRAPIERQIPQGGKSPADNAGDSEVSSKEIAPSTQVRVRDNYLPHSSEKPTNDFVRPPLSPVPVAPAATAPTDEIPATIGRFRIEKLLGKGAFGRVYLGIDDGFLQRRVAIKVPVKERLVDRSVRQNYLSEARILASLDHPHIMPVHECGDLADGTVFLVSKYVEGADFHALLRKKALTIADSVRIIISMARALHHAHHLGLVHRDIKPQNILVDQQGHAYLADFGLALTDDDFGVGARFVGTPSFMSPEQARGEGHRVDGRSDLFSLGGVLYKALTGHDPFRGRSMEEILDQIATADPRPLRMWNDRVSRELERICLKALAKRAADRYQTAADFGDDLQIALDQLQGNQADSAPPPTGEYPSNPNLDRSSNPGLDRPSNPGMERPSSPAFERPSSLNLDKRSQLMAGDSHRGAASVVPKGLRSFDQGDADFFLDLLPGPRDRNGLPPTLRFWKSRIESQDPQQAFAVGILYGPSGCGKSSLVKAGLLPVLSSSIRPVYVEACGEGTEALLLRALKWQCPELADDLTLADCLAALRRTRGGTERRKILLVIDQFEQWLFTHSNPQNTELVEALRQCDRMNVSALILVRDDFWLAASRFMHALEIELREGENSTLIDLFDQRHAEHVLKLFGRAFSVLPPGELSAVQKAFIKEAVQGLAEDGKVIPVRLALFAEMVKSRPWTPGTLKALGGAHGVGTAFLEETFSSRNASPRQRRHDRAARGLLYRLLPESGTEIKGSQRTMADLKVAAGYENHPQDFSDLIRLLDTELRLITPIDLETDPDAPGGDSPEVRCGYQLAHDYLVPTLRNWLTNKRRETYRGRTLLLLETRTANWIDKPEKRNLPTTLEWFRIRLLTDPRIWTAGQKKVMHKGFQQAIWLSSINLALGLVAGYMLADDWAKTDARAKIETLKLVHEAEFPSELQKYPEPGRLRWRYLRPSLRTELAKLQEKEKEGSPQQTRVRLALLREDEKQFEPLFQRALKADPPELRMICEVFRNEGHARHNLLSSGSSVAPVSYAEAAEKKFWEVLDQPQTADATRFHAANALAVLQNLRAAKDSSWKPHLDLIASQLLVDLTVDITQLNSLARNLAPIRTLLIPALEKKLVVGKNDWLVTQVINDLEKLGNPGDQANSSSSR
ncbi:MAG: stkP 5 [Planctomycetaceae bacterium]|nr:stkP 5 [Planctomycetaceae bacterium]